MSKKITKKHHLNTQETNEQKCLFSNSLFLCGSSLQIPEQNVIRPHKVKRTVQNISIVLVSIFGMPRMQPKQLEKHWFKLLNCKEKVKLEIV